MGNSPVRSVGMNLVALQFGPFFCGRIDDDASGRINLASHEKGLLATVAENLDEHFDDVIVGVVVVVQEDDMKLGNS